MSEGTPIVEEVSSPSPNPITPREKAAARRRRILEKSKDRMNVVNGNPAPPNDANDPDPSAAEEETTENDSEVEETETAAAPDDAPAATKSSSTSAARIAQMRRRRYKKAAEEAAAKEEANAEESAADAALSEENVAKEEGSNVVSTKEEVPVPAPAPAPSTDGNELSEGDTKKYMGVVKMRRKKAAEKRKNEDSAIENDLKELEKKIPKMLKPKPVALAPIMFQLFTVIFLFFAGFDVGIQNHAIVKQEVPHIHANLSYVEHGIGAKKIFGKGKSDNQNVLTNLGSVDFAEEDEFGDLKSKPAGATSDIIQDANVDPLFGVDFDQLTAGSGIFFTIARFAVSIHRTLSYLFFLLPLSIFRSILAIPKRLFVNPPVLFLCAVIIRYVGKYVFGGNVPKLDDMIEAEVKAVETKEKPDLASNIASTDFLSMGKNFAANYAKTNFPKVVMVFTIFKDARSDMFVVLCGLFVGLIAPANIMRSSISSEEL